KIDYRPLRRLRWLGRAELCLLARRAVARIGNFEIVVLYTEVSLGIEWKRRAAVDRRGGGMQGDHCQRERTREDLPAPDGGESKPAARLDIGTLFEPDC